ncbi:MAG TPA: HWE histidine kinase domain-containing protein [Pseudolabrys sp.]|nr:HWE histidine kinase domain-containing protein [Pseudolabrys sp.]
MLNKVSEKQAECLLRASEAEQCAAATTDPATKADYERVAHRWRQLARSLEFEGELGRFISFNKNRQKAASDLPRKTTQLPSSTVEEPEDFLDRLARVTAGIKPYSLTAALIAIACLASATLIRFAAGWASSDLRFSIYLPAILAAGLLAGAPAAIAVGIASTLIVIWAFIPPYFEFKWFTPAEQLNVLFDVVPYLITVYFAYCCRVVLLRVRQRELANKLLTQELEHRSNNTFSVVETIVQKTLAHDPVSTENIIGRFRSMRHANELLLGKKSEPVTIKTLLRREFAPYGEDRLITSGPEFEIEPEKARHLILLFHELVTNAAKYGSLSRPTGRVFVDWKWNGILAALTWKEVGGPTIVTPKAMGFGSQLIRVCVQTLSGTIDKKFEPAGLVCSLVLALSATGGLK